MKEGKERKRSVTGAEAWAFVKNVVKSILRGELLLKLKVDKYFIHILYTFILLWMSIWLSMKIDRTLTTVERNRVELNSLEIYHAEKTAELVRLDRLSTMEENLKALGSDLAIPEKPVKIIAKK